MQSLEASLAERDAQLKNLEAELAASQQEVLRLQQQQQKLGAPPPPVVYPHTYCRYTYACPRVQTLNGANSHSVLVHVECAQTLPHALNAVDGLWCAEAKSGTLVT